MTYLQYVFSDKKSAVYWVAVLIFIIILTFFRILIKWNDLPYFDFWDYFNFFFYLIIYFLLYLGFYTSGYLKYKLHEKFKIFYNPLIEKKSIYKVEIWQDKVRLKSFVQNYDVKFLIPKRKDQYEIFKIADSIVVFGQVYDFGVFRRHIRPLQIDLKSNEDKFRYAIKPVISSLEFENDDLIITFKKSLYEINKLIIKDYI